MNSGVADEDQETDTEEELGDAGEIERSRVGKDRHGGEELRGKERARLRSFVVGRVGWRSIYVEAVLGER